MIKQHSYNFNVFTFVNKSIPMKFYISLLTFFFSFISFSQEYHTCKHFEHTVPASAKALKRGSNALMDGYDVVFYNIDLNASNLSRAISGFVEMKSLIKVNNFNKLVVNLSSTFTVDSVLINGVKVTKNQVFDELEITGFTANKGDYLTSKIYYKGNGSSDAVYPVGMLNAKGSNNKSYTYTVSEPYFSYLWWPCKQDLYDKADSVNINITTENTNQVASNGLLTKTSTIGNKKRFEWKTRYPIAYYLVTFATGPYVIYKSYAKIKGRTDSVLIQDYLYDNAALTQYKSLLDKTKTLIELYSEKLGDYPFAKEKYGHFMAPSQMGALENQTMTMIGKAYTFELIAHELSHQWFGNNVTCGTWQDIWLNEGFAEYFGTVLGNEFISNTFDSNAITGDQSEVLSITNSKVYLDKAQTTDLGNIFDHTNSYAKGSTILNMLRFELGDVSFFDLLKSYQVKFAKRNATTDSLIAFVNAYTKKDYTYFFNQWIYGAGHPLFSFKSYQKGDSLYIESNQSGSNSTSFFKMKIDFTINTTTSNDYVTAYQTKNNQVFAFYYPLNTKTATSITPNPLNWNLMKVNSNVFTVLSSGCDLVSFGIKDPLVSATFTGNNIKITVPYGTDPTQLVATFSTSSKATVRVGNSIQVSGVTTNNFTNVITYIVTAENGISKQYTVQVIIAPKPKSNEKSLLSFEFPELLIKGVISNKTVDVTVPFNTDISSLKAKFSISALAKAYIGQVEQLSEVNMNDYTSLITLTVMAEDSTKSDYTIKVTTASNANDNLLIDFGFVGYTSKAIIKGYAVNIMLPAGTNIKALNAWWVISPNAYVRYENETLEQSASNSHDYSLPVKYAVIGSGPSAVYTVFVTLDQSIPKSTEKNILTFGLLSPKTVAMISDTSIKLTVPYGTDVTKLIAEFTVSSLAKVKIQQVEQVSGVTKNDFTKSVVYTVVAEDGSTKEYVVNVTVEKNTASIHSITEELIAVYPNPAQTRIFVSVEEQVQNILVTDIQGKLVYQNHFIEASAELKTIDISQWDAGTYVVQVNTKQAVRIVKIEVQK